MVTTSSFADEGGSLEERLALLVGGSVVASEGISQNTYQDGIDGPVLTSVEGVFKGDSRSSSIKLNGLSAVAYGQSSDGISLRWGAWLEGARDEQGAALQGSVLGERIHWISGAPLSDLPTSGSLTFQSMAYSVTAEHPDGRTSHLQDGLLRSSFSLQLADGAMRFQLGVKPSHQANEILFADVPATYDRRTNLFTIKDATTGVYKLNATGQLYGVQGSHSGLGFVIHNPNSGTAQDLKRAQGVVGYDRVKP